MMIDARKKLGWNQTAIEEQVQLCNLQEMEHCKRHFASNTMPFARYPEIEPMAKVYEVDYSRSLQSRSPQANVAYCEGFEAMSAIPTTCFFEDFEELCAGADTRAEALWKWHLAEEYEHREVVNSVYTAHYGRGKAAHFVRIYGFFFAATQILSNIHVIGKYLLAREREGMTAEQLAASKGREKQVTKLASKHFFRHLWAILSPWYDPAKRQPPRAGKEMLANGSAHGPIVARPALV